MQTITDLNRLQEGLQETKQEELWVIRRVWTLDTRIIIH